MDGALFVLRDVVSPGRAALLLAVAPAATADAATLRLADGAVALRRPQVPVLVDVPVVLTVFALFGPWFPHDISLARTNSNVMVPQRRGEMKA